MSVMYYEVSQNIIIFLTNLVMCFGALLLKNKQSISGMPKGAQLWFLMGK